MRDQAVGVRQGDLFGTFLAMHSDIAHFDLHMERDNVEAANFGAASGDPLHFGNHALEYKGLEGLGGGVPQRGQQGDYSGSNHEEQKFPPARSSGGRFRHRVCTPSPAPFPPGRLSLLSERRDCSQEIINSLTFSWVSSSRILAATSADGTSATTGCFNCGTNFSR